MTETYKVKSVTCPKCQRKLPIVKRKDGMSIHARRIRVLAWHMSEIHGTVTLCTNGTE